MCHHSSERSEGFPLTTLRALESPKLLTFDSMRFFHVAVKFCLSAVAFRAHGTVKLLWTTLTGTRLLERFVDLLLQLHAQ